jgi:hypothetical protein
MDLYAQKAQAFTKRLLSNSALRGFQTLQREEQVYHFIISHQSSLFPTLSSLQFFAGKSWEQILSILFDGLAVVVREILSSEISALLSTIDFGFMAMLGRINYPVSKCRDLIFDFLTKLLVKNEARKAFEGPFTAVKLGMTDRYLDSAFTRNEYIHFELAKVEKLSMPKDAIKNMVKTALFLKPAIHILTAGDPTITAGVTSDIIHRQFAEKARKAISEQLSIIPNQLINAAVDANLSFIENPDIRATSRIVMIFSARCKNYTAMNHIDRGAEHPDKSWFNIARRNYKFHGFDIQMVEELYRIATENGW